MSVACVMFLIAWHPIAGALRTHVTLRAEITSVLMEFCIQQSGNRSSKLIGGIVRLLGSASRSDDVKVDSL